jgi:hypothetical protein
MVRKSFHKMLLTVVYWFNSFFQELLLCCIIKNMRYYLFIELASHFWVSSLKSTIADTESWTICHSIDIKM